MNDLDTIQALVLGIIQGLTEFLPVSSSGHLAIAQRLMHLEADSHSMLLFDVASHLGTLAAVVWVFAGTFRRYLRRLLAERGPDYAGRRIAWRLAGLGVAASIPTALIGLYFKDPFEAAFAKPTWIGVGLLTTGTLLFVTGRLPRPRRGWRQFGVMRALLVGVVQGAAILPGISRSGSTICAAMACGLRRRWAAEFSFFIAVPAICGAALIKLEDTLELSSAELAAVPTVPIAVGALVALVSGVFALRLLLSSVRRGRLQHFCYYCWLLGAIVLVWL
ncbi:MAG: undecaprenyl-diphosphate phosphatase [bacterium]|nr:undecaprenyl-diphosphate phosphatase [bacterium]